MVPLNHVDSPLVSVTWVAHTMEGKQHERARESHINLVHISMRWVQTGIASFLFFFFIVLIFPLPFL